jgi:hypothetical protein
MSLDGQELNRLRRVISIVEKLIANSPKPKRGRPFGATKAASNGKRVRRTGKELVRFRKMLKAERKKGVPVVELAHKHRISTAYIYTL